MSVYLQTLDEDFPRLRIPINYIHIPKSQMVDGYWGFIVISDDTIFNLWNDNYSFDKFTANMIAEVGRTKHILASLRDPGWMWYDYDIGLEALNKTADNKGDVFESFKLMSEVMFETRVFHEVALSKLGVAIGFYPDYSAIYLFNERGEWEKHYNHSQTALHPVKLSYCRDRSERLKVCKYVFGTFRKYLLS
ncbi:unnamed protein product [Enterobius vermicularis]|uniref:DUF3793 family protein n=1 Tax=Enterobius vermicularis TaxID=51028 RepID=A0A0N4VQV5_ENTVE|nr:unnamed protein product [Enterobius vermicularis]